MTVFRTMVEVRASENNAPRHVGDFGQMSPGIKLEVPGSTRVQDIAPRNTTDLKHPRSSEPKSSGKLRNSGWVQTDASRSSWDPATVASLETSDDMRKTVRNRGRITP